MTRISVLFCLFLLAACSSTEPVATPTTESEPEEPSGPMFGALVWSGDALVRHEGTEAVSVARPSRVITRFDGGPAEKVLFSVARGDSTLLLEARQGTVRKVHGVSGPAAYTVAWSQDGSSAAFGHYRPEGQASVGRPRMGEGDVLLYQEGRVTRVGCSASRAALAWSREGRLLVRNTDNLYLVEKDGCATIFTMDARRMHLLTVSPDARHLAFVHRELEYDRASRAYVADSTFRMTDLDGGNPRTIVSFRYHPARVAWNPDGTELAFDVEVPDMPGVRAISITDIASGSTAYLHPPSQGVSEWAPVWAPDGSRLAYRKAGSGEAPVIWVRSFSVPFPEAIEGTENAEIGAWLDPQTLLVAYPDGRVGIHDLGTGDTQIVQDARGIVTAWRLR